MIPYPPRFPSSSTEMKRTSSTKKTRKAQTMKGGEGILTYTNNTYNNDPQLNTSTSRQMFNEQTMMNPRIINGGGKKKNQKNKKKATQKKASKKAAKKKTQKKWFAFW